MVRCTRYVDKISELFKLTEAFHVSELTQTKASSTKQEVFRMSIIYIVSITIVVSLVLLFFEMKIRKIEKDATAANLKLDAILKALNTHYPPFESIPESSINLEHKGDRIAAVKEIIKKFNCTYSQAEKSLNLYAQSNLIQDNDKES